MTINRRKLVFSLRVVGGIYAFGIFYYFKYLRNLNQSETIYDTVMKVSNSHDMARLELHKTGRKFSLLVEKEDALGNFNFDRINLFVQDGKTKIIKKKNASTVYLVNEGIDTMIMVFNVASDGDLILGKIIK